MRKLSLDLEAIAVDSFDTTPQGRAVSRTVQAYQEVPIGGETEQYTCGCTEYEQETCATGCTMGSYCDLTAVSCPDPFATVYATCRFCVSGGPATSCGVSSVDC